MASTLKFDGERRREIEIEPLRAAAPPAPTLEELKARRRALEPTPSTALA